MNQPVLYTVNGTGVPDPFGPGFSSDLGRNFQYDPWQALADKISGVNYAGPPIYWQPIGYPAAVTPMQPSINAGAAELTNQILARPRGTKTFLSGYSQGAMVVNSVWVNQVLNPAGALYDRQDDIATGGVINFGDPNRCPGIANGNVVAGIPIPGKVDGYTSGGIAGPNDLTAAQTPDFFLSCALPGDLYASAPVGDNPWTAEPKVGQVETGIENIIMKPSFFSVVKIAKDLLMPVSTIEGAYNALLFFSKGTNAPHWQYGPFEAALIEWILSRI